MPIIQIYIINDKMLRLSKNLHFMRYIILYVKLRTDKVLSNSFIALISMLLIIN